MDYQDTERFFYEDRQSDVEKVWIVVMPVDQEVYPYGTEEAAVKGAEMYQAEHPENKVQVGWIWDSELSGDFKHTYKCFNPIEYQYAI